MVRKKTLNENSKLSINNGQHLNNFETFSIIPNMIELPPKQGFTFKFKAYSSKVGKISENFILSSQIGNERKR